MLTRYSYLLVIAALALGLLAVACDDNGDDEDTAPTATEAAASTPTEPAAAAGPVEVLLDEWSVLPSPDIMQAGSITFTAINQGQEEHELVVVKTDLAPDALPVVDGKVDEEAAGEEIGEIEGIQSGTEGAATFDLEPGSYVLFCNIVEQEADGELESHYEEGMHVAFTVTE